MTKDRYSSAYACPFSTAFWVVPGRFLAGDYPADIDEQVTREKLCALLGSNIRLIVNLTEENELQHEMHPVLSYQGMLRDLARTQRLHMTYMRIPIPDRDVPAPGTLSCILDLIDRATGAGAPVFVHCWAGRGRTGTVVGCYLKRHGLATDDNVIGKIAELRRLTSNAQKPSPDTLEQVKMVRSWRKGQ